MLIEEKLIALKCPTNSNYFDNPLETLVMEDWSQIDKVISPSAEQLEFYEDLIRTEYKRKMFS